MLQRFIYVSRARVDLGPGAVAELARAAAARNSAEELSGGLVWHEGWFVQVLEGPPASLCAAWERIRHDRRHDAVALRSRERALCRLFGGNGRTVQTPGLVLRTGPSLDPAVLREFDYAAGFPVSDFPADVLVEFMVRACRPAELAPRAEVRSAAAGR